MPAPKKQKLKCDERVWLAISQEKARTQKQIKRIAKIASKDQLGLSLATLMLDRGWVRSKIVAGERIYFPNPNLRRFGNPTPILG